MFYSYGESWIQYFIHNKKSISKLCTSSPWHICDRSECWPLPSACL